MLWCQGAESIGLCNHKLKSVPKCTAWSQCMPVPDGRMDRQMDKHHGISTTIRSNERITR